jgi:hypothetical protein
MTGYDFAKAGCAHHISRDITPLAMNGHEWFVLASDLWFHFVALAVSLVMHWVVPGLCAVYTESCSE